MQRMKRNSRRRGGSCGAFTLVEILIVVIILGILSAVIVPQFSRATDEAKLGTTQSELEKIRRALEVFAARHEGTLPANIAEGDGTWGDLIAEREYLKSAPINQWVGGNGRVIVFGDAPDGAFQADYGWIYDPNTGEIWAGGFDANDEPYPRP